MNKKYSTYFPFTISIECLPKVVNFKSNIVQVCCMNTLMWNYTHEKKINQINRKSIEYERYNDV